MSDQWYYTRQGQRSGPVTQEQLTQLATSGQLQSSDLVWKQGMATWTAAGQTFPDIWAGPPPLPSDQPPPVPTDDAPPPIPTGNAPSPGVVAKSPGTRLAVIILVIVAGVFNLAIGGCTASVSEGVANLGEGLSDLDRQFGKGHDSARMRKEANEMRSLGSMHLGLALLQVLLGIAGGVFAYIRYDNPVTLHVGNVQVKHLLLAGIVILVAAALSISNCFSFITAGVMNTIAGVMTVLRSRSLKT